MAESSTSTETSDISSEHTSVTHDAANGSVPVDAPPEKGEEQPVDPPRRKVFESTLIPERKHRRTPSAIVLVVMIAVAVVIGYLVYGPHPRRHIDTVGMIAYAASETPGGPSKIWIARADGGSARSLSTSMSSGDSPVFSPDGNQIAFISTLQGADRQIFVMDADGQNIRQVTLNSGSKSMPAFAPSSNQLLAYTAGGVLFKTDIGAGDTTRLLPPAPKEQDRGGQSDTDTSQEDLHVTVPLFAWAPGAKSRDEQGLAAVVDNGVGQVLALFPSIDKDPVMSTTTSAGQTVPLAAGSSVTLGWSPDGGLLAVGVMGTAMSGSGGSAILLFSSTGAPQAPILPPDAFVVPGAKALIGPQYPVFSPDGSQVVFEIWSQKDLANRLCGGLFSIAVGGQPTPRLIVRGDVENVQFSADGKFIYYLTRRADGGHDLCEVGIDGAGQRRLSDGKQDITKFSISEQKAPGGA